MNQVDVKVAFYLKSNELLPMYGNSELNKGLKQLAAACGIDRKLASHQSCHTYTTEIALSHGIPIETVSRIIGTNDS